MPNHVLVTERIVKSCEPELERHFILHRLYDAPDREALISEVAPLITAIAGGSVDEALMDRLPNLGMISNFGVGYDSVDTAAARRRGIRVTNTPNVLNDAMAEITMGLMVSLARNILAADRYVREGKWRSGPFPLQAELTGKTAGIVGLGRIGAEIARRCQAMKMRVVYHSRTRKPHSPYVYNASLEDMARNVDWLIVITTGGASTHNLIDARILDALGPKGYLVNMARGSVVDEPALIDALVNKRIAGAALDVFANEPDVPEVLLGLDNVVLSPHMGSATQQTRDAMGALVVSNLEAFFADEPLLTPVV